MQNMRNSLADALPWDLVQQLRFDNELATTLTLMTDRQLHYYLHAFDATSNDEQTLRIGPNEDSTTVFYGALHAQYNSKFAICLTPSNQFSIGNGLVKTDVNGTPLLFLENSFQQKVQVSAPATMSPGDILEMVEFYKERVSHQQDNQRALIKLWLCQPATNSPFFIDYHKSQKEYYLEGGTPHPNMRLRRPAMARRIGRPVGQANGYAAAKQKYDAAVGSGAASATQGGSNEELDEEFRIPDHPYFALGAIATTLGGNDDPPLIYRTNAQQKYPFVIRFLSKQDIKADGAKYDVIDMAVVAEWQQDRVQNPGRRLGGEPININYDDSDEDQIQHQ
jgi:hypothetical protein